MLPARGSATFSTLHTPDLETAWLLTAVIFNRGIFSIMIFTIATDYHCNDFLHCHNLKVCATQWDCLSWPPIVRWQHRGYKGCFQSSRQVRINYGWVVMMIMREDGDWWFTIGEVSYIQWGWCGHYRFIAMNCTNRWIAEALAASEEEDTGKPSKVLVNCWAGISRWRNDTGERPQRLRFKLLFHQRAKPKMK